MMEAVALGRTPGAARRRRSFPAQFTGGGGGGGERRREGEREGRREGEREKEGGGKREERETEGGGSQKRKLPPHLPPWGRGCEPGLQLLGWGRLPRARGGIFTPRGKVCWREL